MVEIGLKEQYLKTKHDKSLSQKEDLVEILGCSKYNGEFYNEFTSFLNDVDITQDVTIKDFNDIFIKSLMNSSKDHDINALQRLLTNKFRKINKSELSNDKKIDYFLDEIIGKQNIEIIEEYINGLNDDDNNNNNNNTTTIESWHNFLVDAGDKLVKPIIAGGMGGMGIFNFLTKGGIESITNNNPILETPGMDNFIQAIITLSILFLIKKGLKYKISNKTLNNLSPNSSIQSD